uniref:Uncharacterized protein n=1 Tax=Malawimonas californiana TaxID=221722 RepID=A0A0B5GFU0_MALCL|nr:hypothetical protein [Malawimonas californiana]AJF22877.1 hypothetical protein [Malawimonas californiana]
MNNNIINNYKPYIFILFLFLLFFFKIVFYYSFYSWVIMWVLNIFHDLRYSGIHHLIESIMNSYGLSDSILTKLDNINPEYDVIDYIILIKFLEVEASVYYSYQLFYTLCFFTIDDVNSIKLIDSILNIY